MSEHDGNHHLPGSPTQERPAFSDRVRSLRLNQPAGRSSGSWLPWALCVLFFFTAAAFGFRAFRPTPAALPKPAETSRQTADSGDVVLESKGYIIPAHQIQVSPKVGGQVMKLYIEEGKQVQKGDVLAELETVDYQSDVDRTEAVLTAGRHRLTELKRNHPDEIKQAKAELDEAKAQQDQLKYDWERSRRLVQTGQSLAPREYEQAESAYKAMSRRADRLELAVRLMEFGPRLDRIRQAEAEIAQAEAELTKAKWRLDNCIVRAPVSGTILSKKAEEGNIVNPSAFSNGLSASLCDMADLSDLEVELTIQERDIAQVQKGQRCRVTAEAFPNRPPYEGVVSRLMPIADRAKGAIPVRVKLSVPKEEEGQFLKPEMGVIVAFLKDKSE